MQQYNIRFYDDADRDSVVDFIKIFAEEKKEDFNEESFMAYFDDMVKKGAVLMAEDDKGNPVGGAVFTEMKNPFTGKRRLHRCDLFIHPDHRDKGLATRLHAKAKECGELVGMEEYSWEDKR